MKKEKPKLKKKKLKTAIQKFASKGGKARWKGISKEARSAEMSRVAKARKLSPVSERTSLHAVKVSGKI